MIRSPWAEPLFKKILQINMEYELHWLKCNKKKNLNTMDFLLIFQWKAEVYYYLLLFQIQICELKRSTTAISIAIVYLQLNRIVRMGKQFRNRALHSIFSQNLEPKVVLVQFWYQYYILHYYSEKQICKWSNEFRRSKIWYTNRKGSLSSFEFIETLYGLHRAFVHATERIEAQMKFSYSIYKLN